MKPDAAWNQSAHRKGPLTSVTSIAAALLMAVGLVGCGSGGESATQADASPSIEPSQQNPSANGASAGTGTKLTWRGAAITLPSGWHEARAQDNKEQLCLLPVGSPDAACAGDKAQDWLYLYASERSGGAPGEPGHPETLDVSGMDQFIYPNGPVPCDESGTAQLKKGDDDRVGGRTAYHGEWKVTCKGGPTFTAQRWLLPKSRLGVVSYALTEQSAAQIRQMITTMDLASFQPTMPS